LERIPKVLLVILIVILVLIGWIVWEIVTEPQLTVDTDKTGYFRQETVQISGLLQDGLGNPIPGETVNIAIQPPTGDAYSLADVTTSPDGGFSQSWLIPHDAELGDYLAVATARAQEANATFT